MLLHPSQRIWKSIVRKKYTIAINVNIRQHIQAVWRCMRGSTQGKNCTTAVHCIQCESKLAKSRNLQTHKKIHSSEKPERCTICEYSCIRKVDMKVHMMQGHTGKRPFKCVQCNFASAQSSYLKTHMRTHMMERPFKCNQCEIAYKSKGGLTWCAGTHQASD